MPDYNVEKYRGFLLDDETFTEMAKYFADKAVAEKKAETQDDNFSEYVKLGIEILLMEGAKTLRSQTESPIEKLLANSLLLGFIKNDPLNLVVLHSVKDVSRQMREFRERREKFKKFTTWYRHEFGSLNDVESFLKEELDRGEMELGEYRWLWRHYVFYEIFSLETSLHMVVQPGVREVNVDGKGIRPDFLFWIPSSPEIKVVVECDGYQFHSGKMKFVSDRKRDRILLTHGYKVVRFSGSEIYADPMAVGSELYDILTSFQDE